MTLDLKDAVAIVTGAGSGIGRAIALEFACNGIAVVCAGRRADRLNETAKQIEQAGGNALAVATDVTDAKQVDHLIAETIRHFGRVDILFNNAGSFDAIGPIWEIDPDLWWRDVTINVRGPMLLSHAVLPHMMKANRGVIINMNGGGSTNPFPAGSGYASSKAALLRLTDSLARELERVGSAVLCVSMGPGLVRTEMTELQVKTEAGLKWMPGIKQAFETGKTRPPEDCARATIKLLNHLRPEFNGRIFGPDDDFADLASRAKELMEKDLRTLRGR
jgi:NAD(P)-dependent dehydrogenase (short-subunit alcohol dehydrogenase family)